LERGGKVAVGGENDEKRLIAMFVVRRIWGVLVDVRVRG